MNDLKIGDFVRGNIVRTNRTAEGTVLGVHERTVSIDNGKGDRVMLDKQGIENIGMGAKIKARRKELKLSQNELSEKIGVHFTSISLWETEKNVPAADKIEALEKALGISLSGLSTKAFNGVTVSYDPSVITKKPLREKDILDSEGNFKNIVPAFKEPEKKEPEIEQVAPAHPWRTYETEVAAKVEPAAVVPEKVRTLELKPEDQGIIRMKEIESVFSDTEPFITISPLDLDEILTTFFPRFGNFHADYQLAGAFELLLQAEAGNACLDDLRKARAKLDKAIKCLEK